MAQEANGGGTGRCLCGAVQYRYQGEPATMGICQCDRCQRQSGSAFLIGVIFPKEAVTIDGPLSTYEAKADGKKPTLAGISVPNADRPCLSPGSLP